MYTKIAFQDLKIYRSDIKKGFFHCKDSKPFRSYFTSNEKIKMFLSFELSTWLSRVSSQKFDVPLQGFILLTRYTPCWDLLTPSFSSWTYNFCFNEVLYILAYKSRNFGQNLTNIFSNSTYTWVTNQFIDLCNL